MFAALVFVSSALAGTVDYAFMMNTEPGSDGTCSPTLSVRADTSLHVLEEDGQPLSISNYRYFLDSDYSAGCTVMLGLLHAAQCGPDRSDGDGSHLWRVDVGQVDEGDFGTLYLLEYGLSGNFDEQPLSAEVSWSCGECDIAADIDGDGVVSITDYLDLLTAIGTTVPDGDPRDVDDDGYVGGLDLVEVVYSLGDECPEGL